MKIRIIPNEMIRARNDEHYLDLTSAVAINETEISLRGTEAMKESKLCCRRYGFYIRNSIMVCDIKTNTVVIFMEIDPCINSAIEDCCKGAFRFRANKCVREIERILYDYGFNLEGRLTLLDSRTGRYWT